MPINYVLYDVKPTASQLPRRSTAQPSDAACKQRPPSCVGLHRLLVSVSTLVYFRRHRTTGESTWSTIIAPLLSVGAIGWLLYFSVSRAERLLGLRLRSRSSPSSCWGWRRSPATGMRVGSPCASLKCFYAFSGAVPLTAGGR